MKPDLLLPMLALHGSTLAAFAAAEGERIPIAGAFIDTWRYFSGGIDLIAGY